MALGKACFLAVAVAAAAAMLGAESVARAGEAAPGVVSNVKVVSDKVDDVSSMEALKAGLIKPGMTDQEKAVAMFNCVVGFVHHEIYVRELLDCPEGCVHDPIKAFNVYGHAHCCCTGAYMEALARSLGWEARGWTTPGHSIPEVSCGGAWRMLDPAFINYFPKADGSIAGVDEIVEGVSAWLAANPEIAGDEKKQREFMRNEGWRKGPEVLSRCPFFNANGWLPENGHGWYSMLRQFGTKAKVTQYDYGYTTGYRVNIQLRPGERLTRNWSNKGLCVGKDEGLNVASMTAVPGRDAMEYSPKFGDLTQGRIGNGLLEYDVPVGSPDLARSVLTCNNLAVGKAPALKPRDAAAPGVLVVRMPSSYVYLTGRVTGKALVGAGGAVKVELSDNNGLDWKPVAELAASGELNADLKPLVYLRYDYRLRLTLSGAGTGLDSIRIVHDVQQSQRALPALALGANAVAFTAGPQEGAVTVHGCMNPDECKGKQLSHLDFHPVLKGLDGNSLRAGGSGAGEASYAIATPGDITRLRVSASYRARDAKDCYDVQASFDDGKTFVPVGRLEGPFRGTSKALVLDKVPAGSRSAVVRLAGKQANTIMVFALRIDADYAEPAGGWRPVKITYLWEENGAEKRDVHVAKSPEEKYVINCAAKPVMKSVALELVE